MARPPTIRCGSPAPIAHAIGLPDVASVQRRAWAAPSLIHSRASRVMPYQAPIAYAIGLPDAASVKRDGTGSPKPCQTRVDTSCISCVEQDYRAVPDSAEIEATADQVVWSGVRIGFRKPAPEVFAAGTSRRSCAGWAGSTAGPAGATVGVDSAGTVTEGTLAAGEGIASAVGAAGVTGFSTVRVSAAVFAGSTCCRGDAVQPSATGAAAAAGLSLNVLSGAAVGGVSGRADEAAGAGTVS